MGFLETFYLLTECFHEFSNTEFSFSTYFRHNNLTNRFKFLKIRDLEIVKLRGEQLIDLFF